MLNQGVFKPLSTMAKASLNRTIASLNRTIAQSHKRLQIAHYHCPSVQAAEYNLGTRETNSPHISSKNFNEILSVYTNNREHGR